MLREFPEPLFCDLDIRVVVDRDDGFELDADFCAPMDQCFLGDYLHY
jgi:hypothetical protein